jgi:hypothetical protein
MVDFRGGNWALINICLNLTWALIQIKSMASKALITMKEHT